MTLSAIQARPSEKGFTLVELAIVMIIIGLLIGGILKGQELINNSRVTATVSQAKAIEAGISGFRDKYAGFPGDIAAPTTRLQNCVAATLCANPGNGDGRIQGATANDPGAANAVTNESSASFTHLAAAGMIGGVNSAATVINTPTQSNPATPIDGAWKLGFSDGTGTARIGGALEAGHYIVGLAAVGAAAAAANAPFNPAQAANIDTKLDDGRADSGTVRGIGANAAATNCANAGVYQSSQGGKLCGLYVKVQ